MSYLPCLNPHCKSHGKPHPNCRCYSGGENYSEGGQVGHFCSTAQEHNSDCEYFSGGGEVAPDFIPDEASEAPDFIPDTKDSAPDFIPDEEAAPDFIPDEKESPETDYLETAKAATEGASQGVLGPFAPMLQVGLGLSTKEDIKRRAEEHPIAHGIGETAGLVGGLLTGAGEAALFAKGAGAVAKAAELGKVGSIALKAAVEASSFATSDEMTKAFLSVRGSDPEHPVSSALLHVGAAGLLGGLTGGVFTLGEGLIGKGLASDAGAKAASKAQEFLFKLGSHPNPAVSLGIVAAETAYPAYKTAEKLEDKTGLPAWMTYLPIQAIYAAAGYRTASIINPYITSAAVKALSDNEASAIPNVFHYVNKAVKGAQQKVDGVGALFGIGSSQIAPPTSDFLKEQLKEFVEGGQVDQQIQNNIHDQAQDNNFAQGGEVTSEPSTSFSKVFPEQNMLLNAAKGRISGYLNSIRPLPNQQKLPFDKKSKDTDKHREYDKAIDLAVNPLSILDHVNKGDLTPGQMKHFTSLYPEVHNSLSKEMTKKITEAQLKGEMPPYKKRQAMSLFLGANLDSTFTPMAIQTIQGLYAKNQMAKQQQAGPKKGAKSLEKASNPYQTDEQARERRMQNRKT